MTQALLKHYGKILLTVLVLGLSAYFRVDVGNLLGVIGNSDPAPASTPAQLDLPDAGE